MPLLNKPAQATADPTQAIEAIQNLVLPTVQRATDWAVTVGFGIFAAQAFYALVVRLIKMGD